MTENLGVMVAVGQSNGAMTEEFFVGSKLLMYFQAALETEPGEAAVIVKVDIFIVHNGLQYISEKRKSK